MQKTSTKLLVIAITTAAGYDNVEQFINTVLEAGLETGAEKQEQERKKKK